jgi:replicative DNA helicase
MSLGLQFIQALLTSGNASPLRDVREEFFVKAEKEAFLFVKRHLARHGVLPDSDTLLEHGIRVSRAIEPPSYYSSKLRDRYVYNLIANKNPELVGAMKEKDTARALSIIRELASLGGHILEPDSFSTLQLEATELVADYLRIKESGQPELGTPFGWPTLDEMTLGMQGGDLVVLAGRPNVGKSWVLLAMAYNAWCAGHSIGILSMEMSKRQIVRRFVSLITRTNPNLIRQGTLSSWAEELLRGTVRGLKRRPPVYVNSTDMQHKSTLLVEKLLSEHTPDVVFIDSAYRLTPKDARGNMSGWERQSQMVGELKQNAIHFDRPVVAVNQYNRSVKSKGGKAELGTAAGTDSWEQDSSMFMGIRFGPAPFEESSRIIDLTKDREGPLGSLRINFGFDPVDFSEIAGDEHYETTEDSEWSE